VRIKSFRWTTAACGLILALAAACPALAQAVAAPPVAAPAPAPAAVQAPAKPLAVVAIASYDKLMQDVDFLGSLVQQPSASQMVDGILKQMTGNKGLVGLDKSKPIGLLVDMSMMFPNFAAYLPVTDQPSLLATLQQSLGITNQDMGNGVFQVNAMGQDLYVKNNSGWTLVGMSPAGFDALPADPSAVLGALTAQYDVAVQINVQSLPPALKQQAMASMGAAAGALTKLESETDQAFAARQKALQDSMATSQQMMNELDQVNLGLAIAGEQQKVYLDLNFLAIPGTKLAEELSANAQAATNFAGFADEDAAASLQFAAKVSGANAAAIEQVIGEFRAKMLKSIEAEAKEEQRAPLGEALGQIVDAVLETVKAGSVDGGAVVNMDEKSASVVVGGLIADPKKIADGLKKLADTLGEGDDALPEIEWDAETHNGVVFHTMSVPLKDGDEETKALVGDELEVVVGLGAKSAYLAWGRDASDALKAVIDASAAEPGKKGSPIELTVTLSTILDSMESVAPEDKKPALEMISSVLATAEGKDHVHLVAQPVANGMQVRFELEQGVLQAIGASAKMGMAGGGAPAPGPAAAPAGAGQ
jgi:hypothetical protein